LSGKYHFATFSFERQPWGKVMPGKVVTGRRQANQTMRVKGPMVHIRLDKDLHKQLQEATERNGTSLQSEIVLRLKKTFADDDQLMTEIRALNARLDKAEAEAAEMWTPLPKLGEQYTDWVKRITATKK